MSVGRSIAGLFSAGAACIGLLAPPALYSMSAGATEGYSEEAIKAAYLYRIAGYVKWPEPLSPDEPFVIDVVNAPGVARALRVLLRDHPIDNHIAEIREVAGKNDWGPAKLVYVSNGHADALRTLKPGRPARLIVTDQEDGLSAGGIVNLITLDRNVRFEVSLAAADRWGLKISSELLGVALRVQGGGHP
jgi:hypothetical protein